MRVDSLIGSLPGEDLGRWSFGPESSGIDPIKGRQALTSTVDFLGTIYSALSSKGLLRVPHT